MILGRETTNNGYGCLCCGRNEEYATWLEEEEMLPFDKIVEKALRKGIKKDMTL